MWIDTHCHLDACEFGGETAAIASRAAERGVAQIVIPAVERGNFEAVASLAAQHSNCSYALGIHPVCVPNATQQDLDSLRGMIPAALQDPRFVAIGEIGLDYFIPALTSPAMREKQEYFYGEQLKIARDFDLPVLLHVRRSQDMILKYLRRIAVPGGIAHAFNGSHQQADIFIGLGFKLGFGGAMTFPRALQIRRLAGYVPQDCLVLETDAPDIAPAWLHPAQGRVRNSPEQLPRIGETLAGLRGLQQDELARITCANARNALPRLVRLI